MKKGFIIGLATGLTVAGASLVLANSQIQAILNDQIKVTLNGQVQEFKDETTNETQYPITYHDRTYLPLRTVANLVGVDVDYDAKSNTAMLKNDKESNNVSVVDAVNYSYDLFKIKLPKITGNTKTIEEINKKILDEMLPYTYKDVKIHTSMTEALNKGSIYDYKYTIKNNILVIYIYSYLPEGGSGVPASGGGTVQNSYYYDITKDKILSLGEAAKILNLELNKIADIFEVRNGKKLETYDDLDNCNYIIIKIEGNELKLISLD